jgi:conjugative relaxase-like TrwC/TraI family protein
MRVRRCENATQKLTARCVFGCVIAHLTGRGERARGGGREARAGSGARGGGAGREGAAGRAGGRGRVGAGGARRPGVGRGSAARADRRVQRHLLVTVRVTSLTGADAGGYYVDPERHGLATYYLDAGEPPGMWLGKQAAALGLAGDIDPEAFLSLVDGHAPTGEKLGRAYTEESVRGYDVTFSAPKSVSTLWALGDERVAGESLAAHDAAVQTVIEFVERHATTRPTIDGRVQNVDVEGLAIAVFRQHTSRMLDPQLHSHAVVVAKVRIPDGRWLALDARMIKCDQRTLSALYHATLRSELTARLGVRWQTPEHGIAEVDYMPDAVLDELSQRTRQVEARLDQKLDRFREEFDREPTQRELWRLEREAVLDSRPAKQHIGEHVDLRGEWAERIEGVGFDPRGVVDDAIGGLPGPGRLTAEVQVAMVDQALTTLSAEQSTWRPNDLLRELARALPTTVHGPPAELVGVLERLTESVLDEHCVDLTPAGVGALRASDGRPTSESILDRRYTAQAILDEELAIVDWADERWCRHGTPARLADADRLDPAQAHTAALAAGTNSLVAIVGPAGTGKTTMLRAAVNHLVSEGRPVFGVAPSAAAAEVLGHETGVDADTIDKLLVEYSTPGRLPEPRYLLPAGTTVLVDEAGMLATPKLADLTALADHLDWRVVLVGDPLQFSAVGRGGMFNHLLDHAPDGAAIEHLERVHRFSAEWEADASLRLRRGDLTALDDYDEHGRIHGALTATDARHQVIGRWRELRAGGDDVVMLAATNDSASELNRAAQRLRLAAGEVARPLRPVTLGDGAQLLIGDEVQTRRNDRSLTTDVGVTVKNRHRWIVDEIGSDGSLTVVDGERGRVTLPRGYVADAVSLAYASTAMAGQGRTVDHSLVLVDGPIDAAGLYVPMTRGRDGNDVWVVTDPRLHAQAVDVLSEVMRQRWVDEPAIEHAATVDVGLE